MTRFIRRTVRRGGLAVAVAGLVVGFSVVTGPAAWAAPPTVAAVTPRTGTLDTLVTVTGSRFVAPVTVRFGSTAATAVKLLSATKLTVRVPLGAASGPVTVTDPNGTATSGTPFTVKSTASVTPTATPPGTAVTLKAGGFASSEPVDLYAATSDVALAVAGSGGAVSASVTVPASAPPGVLWLTAVGRRSGHAAQTSVTVRTNWTQLGGGAAHLGVNTYENVLSPGTVGGLDEAWRFATGAAVLSSPALAGGVVYVGSGDQRVYALDAATGAPKWSFATGGGVRSSPAVVGGVVFAGSLDGDVYALDAATGALKWAFATDAAIFGSPAVTGGVVFIASGAGTVYALDAATGAQRWASSAGGFVEGAPAVGGGLVYVGSADHALHAFDAATGAARWSFTTGDEILTTPALSNGTVYIGSNDTDLYALNATTGALRWAASTPGGAASSAAVWRGVVYAGSFDDTVSAHDTATGSLLWTRPLPGYVEAAPVIAGGVAFVACGDGSVDGLDTGSGAVLWSAATGGALDGAAAVADGQVTVASADATVRHYSLDAASTPQRSRRPDPASLRPDRRLTARTPALTGRGSGRP